VPGSNAFLPGSCFVAKGQTEQERSDRVEDIVTDNAGWRGNDERRHDGKHRSVQEQDPLWMVPDNLQLASVRNRPVRTLMPGLSCVAIQAKQDGVASRGWPLRVSPGEPIG